MADALDVFLSFSHDDEAHLQELLKHLALLKRQGLLNTWHDREISGGEEWRGQIDEKLEAAQVILLLVSPSFIASDYCWDVETQRALERHGQGEARAIPVIVRPCEWRESPFAELQALPEDGKPVAMWKNRDAAWLDVVRGLRQVLTEAHEGPSPDVVVAPAEEPQPKFRDEETRELSETLSVLYQRRERLAIGEGNTQDLDGKILDVRRLLRQGPQLQPGEFLGHGRYRLLEPVGQGGFATVWKSWDTQSRHLVAVKVLHGQFSEDRSRRERFFRGARKMGELAHPHIVRVLESEGSEGGWHFFVMEYLGGGNFEQAVLGGGLSEAERLEVVLQVGEALGHAHGKGVVHRDVKPANILLDAAGEAKLTDFDLVRAEDTTGLTRSQAMMGTLHFAAPEALESASEVEPSADVYSLAATTVFALSGRRLPSHFYRDPLGVVGGLKCSEPVRAVLKRGLASVGGDRFATAGAFCGALKRACSGPPAVLPGGPRVSEAGTSWIDPLLGLKFSYIPPGTFWMGSPEGEAGRYDRETRHQVTLTRGFWMACTAVRVKDYARFVEDRALEVPGGQGGADHPIVKVSWEDCRAFCKWVSERLDEEFRLPTEAEWEYSARAGTETATYVGDLTLDGNRASELEPIAWYSSIGGGGAKPVGQKQANGFGLYDILGNVYEWTADIYGAYPAGPLKDPLGLEGGPNRVIRGGSWSSLARYCRAANRGGSAPGRRVDNLGFRLVRTALR